MHFHIEKTTFVAAAVLAATSGCVLAPRTADEQRAALARTGAPYREPFEERALPELPHAPTWRDVVARALAADGEVEAAYFAWATAVHRIDRAGAYPNTPISLDVRRMLSGGDTSVMLGFDPMETLAFPAKVYQGGKVATSEAEAAGLRFLALRFDRRRRVLAAWADYGLAAVRVRLAADAAGLRRVQADASAARVSGGGDTAPLIAATDAVARARDEEATLAAGLTQSRSTLNAMMARPFDAPLPPPSTGEPPRVLAADDDEVLAVAAVSDPELAVLAREVAGRRDALTLARLQYIPDVNPFVGMEGAAAQLAGAAISIPTLLRSVGAMVRESRAELDAALARQRQARFDRAAAVVAALSVVRDGERRLAIVHGPLRSNAERAVDATERAYANASAAFDDVVAARTQVLEVALLAAEVRATHQRAVADLEALLGVDVETLAPASVAVAR